jgi:glycosyltransferase involved in cell wall biosynthesis
MSKFIVQKHCLYNFSIVDSALSNISIADELDFIPSEQVCKLRERPWISKKGFLQSISYVVMDTYNYTIGMNKIINKAVNFGKLHKIDAVWCILQGQTIFRVAIPVSNKLKVPLMTQVWDSPKWWLKDNHVDSFSTKKILKIFDETIKYSVSCATASWNMSNEYEKKYGVPTIPITASIDKRLACAPGCYNVNVSKFVIGMAGQIYANQEWESLIQALDKCDWVINGKEIIIRYFGYSFNISGHKKARIEYMGYRSQDEVIRFLSGADILYCPYFFDKSLEEVARTSFPSKLVTYLASGRPIFYHGPKYGSPAIFIEKYKVGAACYSLDPEDINFCLSRLLENRDVYELMSRNSIEVFNSYFTDDILKQNTFKFIASAWQ